MPVAERIAMSTVLLLVLYSVYYVLNNIIKCKDGSDWCEAMRR